MIKIVPGWQIETHVLLRVR